LPAASIGATRESAAVNSAIVNYPGQRFTLRNGILAIREHGLAV
jgi:hypothetical protein